MTVGLCSRCDQLLSFVTLGQHECIGMDPMPLLPHQMLEKAQKLAPEIDDAMVWCRYHDCDPYGMKKEARTFYETAHEQVPTLLQERQQLVATIERLLKLLEGHTIGCTAFCERRHQYGDWDTGMHEDGCLVALERKRLEEVAK